MELPKLEFRDLADLRLFLHELRNRQVLSLKEYHDAQSGGFHHRRDKRVAGQFSKSSTATCVLSLIATSRWLDKEAPWNTSAAKLCNGMLQTEWKSAGLPPDNLFTVAFILEAVTNLQHATAGAGDEQKVVLEPEASARLEKAETILRDAALGAPEALNVLGYPPSAYVAQLVVRTLKSRPKGFVDEGAKISRWAEREINKQFALLTRNDKTADVFQLAYALILLTNLIEPASVTPDQDFIIDAALDALFSKQRDDGTWPLSRPLFHYPDVGSAHCYDYEMLVQLLSEPRLSEKLLRSIPSLRRTAHALRSYFPLGSTQRPQGRGWSSGHHPQLAGPESWSTASVYHFAHVFERLLAEQVRIETFAYLGTAYSAPRSPTSYSETLGSGFLDCDVGRSGQEKSLKSVVAEKILKPLIGNERAQRIESGGKLSDDAPVSMIFFGPPGTSKTDLAKRIARVLGWPLLTIDASQFLKKGMDGVYAEADTIFGMLAVAERTLVLLDEFDEMVRARETAPDVLSRFLTTAMLPKLHKIHDNRRLVFVVATNHIDWFDVAIRRPGRFDVILQVMPPTASAKLAKDEWPDLRKIPDVAVENSESRKKLAALTYLETDILVGRLKTTETDEQRLERLDDAYANCTMRSEVPTGDSAAAAVPTPAIDKNENEAVEAVTTRWEDVCIGQSAQIRV